MLTRFSGRAAARTVRRAALALIGATTLSLGFSQQPQGTLVVGTALEPNSLVMNYVSDGAVPYINLNILSKLAYYDVVNKDIYPDLAESWSVTDDLLTYTINLRQGVRWHDGEPFTSADVQWTLQDILDRGNSAYTYSFISDIGSIETPDDHTVILHLSRPNGIMMESIASNNSFTILPRHLYEGTDALQNPLNWAPIGTGPFRFVEHVAGSHVMLEAYPDYHGEGPYLERVVFQFIPNLATAILALESGQVGYITATPPFADAPRLSAVPGIDVISRSSPIVMWFGINTDREIWRDVRVRRALGHAINTDEFSERLYQGLAKGAQGYFTSAVEWANSPEHGKPPFDLAEAERLLDEAGYPRGADGWRFDATFVVFRTNIFGSPEQAQLVKQQLAEVGINVNVELYEFAVRGEIVNTHRNFDLIHSGGIRGPDPSEMATYYGTNEATNLMRYSNPEVDRLLDAGKRTADREERAAIYAELQAVLAEDVPVVNLIEYSYLHPYSTRYTGFFFMDEAAGKASQHMFNLVRLAD